ncbi:AsnC family protein [Cupriavidus consociatus]|uniref:AsnC family protein n=1 Tax=Cupriavidus consociatus TaxID=2821357 RepID=UPI001B0B9F93|nr:MULTISPECIES: AsnC family protein [unclassified Cupriavidus]MBP0624010.1 AsnC family protein [Cupriavidus sp. LEh25]MDK2660719.1 AsnC family protein [Cupriavidus sp. LEh21]
MKPTNCAATAQRLITELQADGRSASEIARLSGVSQPTVSRLRNATTARVRHSESFSKLCNFYRIPGTVAEKNGHGYNELLRDAIIEAWDGSEAHGKALLEILQSLKYLRPSPRGDKQRPT